MGVVCCVLFVVIQSLVVGCGASLLFVVCSMLFVACCVLCVGCCLLCGVC